MEELKMYLEKRKEELIGKFNEINKDKTTYNKFDDELFESMFIGNAKELGEYYNKLEELDLKSTMLFGQIKEIKDIIYKIEQKFED